MHAHPFYLSISCLHVLLVRIQNSSRCCSSRILGRSQPRRAVLAGLRKTISDNAAQFNVRTRRASISAVDLEWNFAEINMGDTKGIDVNDRVIVERSGQRVGMLVVKTVGRGQIIGNIVPEAGGGAIQAGDSVVFDKKEEES